MSDRPRAEEGLEKEAQIVQESGAKTLAAGEPRSLAEEVDTLSMVLGESKHSIYIRGLIDRLMSGTEQLERPLKPWEPEKLNAAHINMVMLKAAGFKNVEIAEILGFGRDQGRISVIICHPGSQKLLRALIPLTVGRAIDVKTRMTSYASQMLERLYDIGMASSDEKVVTRIGFGLLDRAGFGAVKEVKNTHEYKGPASQIKALAKALSDSKRVDEVVDANYSIRPLPERGEEPEQQLRLPTPSSHAAESTGPAPTSIPSQATDEPREDVA